jgi:hypothetical protein
MKDATVLNQDKTKNEGYTQVEIQAEIRRRAYQRFEQRGRVDGYALTDWLLAEAEVMEPRPKAAA